MLVITWKIGEKFRIGDEVSISVVNCNGGSARLGITAPKHIAIHREEIYNMILADGLQPGSNFEG